MMGKLINIERFILEQQPVHAHGDLTNLLYDIALAAKIISHKVNRAGLVDILGRADNINVQGEEQQKLDLFADDIIRRICDHTGRVCVMASEERDGLIEIPAPYKKGPYALVFDPLDGSSNIDVNVSIGTIFGIFRAVDDAQRGREADLLQPGYALAAAGYVLYGSSTMMVYSTGSGVHGFTLDPDLGEFLLSHESIRFPEPPRFYSVNTSYYHRWSPAVQRYMHWLEGSDAPPMSSRYIGSMVSDFHRNLLRGGIFLYPAEANKPEGKLRLLYEVAPLAFLAEQAGGYASDGYRSVLEIMPTGLHQRTPIFVGNRSLVEKAEEFLRAEPQTADLPSRH